MKEYIGLITALGVPILVAISGIVTWFLKTKKEELSAAEERARERRIETYKKLLHPFIVMLSNVGNEKVSTEAVNEVKSVEYREAAFNLMTFGSDDMVNTYNTMMQGFYKSDEQTESSTTLRNFAAFILSIRKDLYDKNTKMKDWDMLKFMIKDIDTILNKDS